MPLRAPFQVWKVVGIDKQVPQDAPLKCPRGSMKQVDVGALQHCRDERAVGRVLSHPQRHRISVRTVLSASRRDRLQMATWRIPCWEDPEHSC